jgi:hypothetical protein
METRSKVKGVPQGIPTTPFVEEVSETLPLKKLVRLFINSS